MSMPTCTLNNGTIHNGQDPHIVGVVLVIRILYIAEHVGTDIASRKVPPQNVVQSQRISSHRFISEKTRNMEEWLLHSRII